jgi:hypothetical protein
VRVWRGGSGHLQIEPKSSLDVGALPIPTFKKPLLCSNLEGTILKEQKH